MKSKYLFRGINNKEQELLNNNKLNEMKPIMYKKDMSYNDMIGEAQYHIKQKKAFVEDTCISLTSSITVARFYANNRSNNRIIVINKNDLDKSKLLNMSTPTLYYSYDLCGDPDDIRRDGYMYKGMEYVYNGIITKFTVLPKWLEDYIFYIRNVFDENDLNGFQNFDANKDFLCENLGKLVDIYINGNYSSLEDLYNKNKLLVVNRKNKAQKKYLKNVSFDLIKENLNDKIKYIEENSLTIKRRREIDLILDSYINNEEKYSLKIIKNKLPNIDLIRIFYYKYYVESHTLNELCDSFLNKQLVEDTSKKSLVQQFEILKFYILNCLRQVFTPNIIIEDRYTLFDCSNNKPLEVYGDKLKLINIDTKEYDDISIKKSYTKGVNEHLYINNKYANCIEKIPLKYEKANLELLKKIGEFWCENINREYL